MSFNVTIYDQVFTMVVISDKMESFIYLYSWAFKYLPQTISKDRQKIFVLFM